MKRIPASGLDDFRLIAEKGYYVDKSGFIVTLLRRLEGTTTLITRPRRFGKSLMLSMVNSFFSLCNGDDAPLFEPLDVMKDPDAREEQNRYPVIRMNLKEAKRDTWEKTYDYIKSTLIDIAQSFTELRDSTRLSVYQRQEYEKLCSEASSETVFVKSLYRLCELLHAHYQRKVIILIDEYDAPISKAYLAGYYPEAIDFFRSFYGVALKGNEHLRFALVSGVMQIAKESLFSDLNNPDIDSVIDGAYSRYYGFSKVETMRLLDYYGLKERLNEVWDWYGGYRFGGEEVGNPWSILKFVEREGKLACYWVSTGENAIIGKMVSSMDENGFKAFSSLLGEGSVQTLIRPSLSYRSLGNGSDDVFSYLLSSGYLSVREEFLAGSKAILTIPNKEARIAFETEVYALYAPKTVDIRWPNQLKESILAGRQGEIGEILSAFLLQSLNYFSYADWRSYQYLILGLTVALFPSDIVKSEVVAGKGRCDILVFSPKEKYGLAIEVKMASTRLSTYNLRRLSQSALKQAINNKYCTDLRERGAEKILAIGIGAYKDKAEVALSKIL